MECHHRGELGKDRPSRWRQCGFGRLGHLTLDQKVPGSSPGGPVGGKPVRSWERASSGEAIPAGFRYVPSTVLAPRANISPTEVDDGTSVGCNVFLEHDVVSSVHSGGDRVGIEQALFSCSVRTLVSPGQ